MINRILTFIIIMTVASCGFATYEDVSTRKEYAALVGQEYRLREEMLIHAVTMDRNYKKVIDKYTITPKPGFDGPEVIYRRALPAGTTMHITAVEKCNNWWCYRLRLHVTLPDLEYANHPVTIGDTFGGNDILKSVNGRTVVVSPILELLTK